MRIKKNIVQIRRNPRSAKPDDNVPEIALPLRLLFRLRPFNILLDMDPLRCRFSTRLTILIAHRSINSHPVTLRLMALWLVQAAEALVGVSRSQAAGKELPQLGRVAGCWATVGCVGSFRALAEEEAENGQHGGETCEEDANIGLDDSPDSERNEGDWRGDVSGGMLWKGNRAGSQVTSGSP